MATILSYSIISSLLLTSIFGFWQIVRHATSLSPSQMRIAAMTTIVASLLLPAIVVPLYNPATGLVQEGGIEIVKPLATIVAETRAATEAGWLQPLIYTYTIVAGIILLHLLLSIGRIVLLRALSRKATSADGSTVFIHNRSNLSPFSWAMWIFLNETDASDPNANMIITHEKAHIDRRHWLDIIVAQSLIALQWYNPLAWMTLHDLQDIHEYQADADTIGSGIPAHAYQMFIIKKTVGARFAAIANSLNHSSLNKRITMMLSKKSNRPSRLRAVSATAVAIAAAMALTTDSLGQAVNHLTAYDTIMATGNKVKDFSPTIETSAQSTSTTAEILPDNAPDVLPAYPGGLEGLMNFLMYNVKYPEEAMKAGIEGKVAVKFIVGKDGHIYDPIVISDTPEILNNEALRVIKLLDTFEPATTNGQPVNCEFVLPINFKIPKKN